MPDPIIIPDGPLRLIQRDFAREHALLVVQVGEELVLQHAAEVDPAALHNLRVYLRRSGYHIARCEVVAVEGLRQELDAVYERLTTPESETTQTQDQGIHIETHDEAIDLDRLLADADRDLLSEGGKAPLIKLVDRLLLHAVRIGASDLHLQPLSDQLILRHRVDGVLDPGRSIPVRLHRPIVSRIKVMARMDVAERLLPQDGRATVLIGERPIDLRVSSLPTAYGERMVIRLLDHRHQLCDFARLGMPAEIGSRYLAAARKTSGIILVTGPTGSGKTTTLYATLRELGSTERNIITIEDPIEYELDSLGLPISQSQVNEKKGVTFAGGLRHILRQDPDIILVGEIRDAETARIAIQSSLTGHLVVSTLHTNDAVSAITRLIDLGVEPYLVSASLMAVLAQRLVRTCCPEQRESHEGCPTCLGCGYSGRTGLFEYLEIDAVLRSKITANVPLEDLRATALASGMRTLAMEGHDLIAAGRTTTTEVERVCHA